jgi:hypothetical protein
VVSTPGATVTVATSADANVTLGLVGRTVIVEPAVLGADVPVVNEVLDGCTAAEEDCGEAEGGVMLDATVIEAEASPDDVATASPEPAVGVKAGNVDGIEDSGTSLCEQPATPSDSATTTLAASDNRWDFGTGTPEGSRGGGRFGGTTIYPNRADRPKRPELSTISTTAAEHEGAPGQRQERGRPRADRPVAGIAAGGHDRRSRYTA